MKAYSDFIGTYPSIFEFVHIFMYSKTVVYIYNTVNMEYIYRPTLDVADVIIT